MKLLLLAGGLTMAAMPLAHAQTDANPGMVIANVYQNADAGFGYGIGSGFGLPQGGYYRDGPRHGYAALGYAEEAPAAGVRRKTGRHHPVHP